MLKTLGPGILLAGAAIGGSHLVQSTKAGAIYGFGLIWAVVLANLFKYPFFEFCRRYTCATGETIIAGYLRLGRWALICFLLISTLSAFLNITALTAVTAALASQLFGTNMTMFQWSIIVCSTCVGILVFGRYPALDFVIKVIVLVLAISTFFAFLTAASHGSNAAPGFTPPTIWTQVGIAFLLALMGWMPAPIDVAVFPSLWAIERMKQTGHHPNMRETMFDFNLGYIGAGGLALVFLGLGALVMFGTGETPAQQGPAFSNQLIRLYTATLGDWTFYFIAAAAFTCIFSTTLTCFDAYTRAVHASFCLATNRPDANREDKLYWAIMGSFVVVTLLVTGLFVQTMGDMVNIATIIAFLTAPVLAYVNYRVITSSFMPAESKPPKWLIVLSLFGMVFLLGFALLYVASFVVL